MKEHSGATRLKSNEVQNNICRSQTIKCFFDRLLGAKPGSYLGNPLYRNGKYVTMPYKGLLCAHEQKKAGYLYSS